MILQRFILTIFLVPFAARAAVLDHEPPVFTSCPRDIVIDDAITPEVRVNWQLPTITDNSGELPVVYSTRQPGDLFGAPGLYKVVYTATDASGNKATCSFKITVKRKTCQLHDPPKNGALACNKVGTDHVCAAMCKDGFDFVSIPALLYYCSAGQWQYFSVFPISSQPVPWPNCSNTANPSYLKQSSLTRYFFDGGASDVQATIKTNYISLMTKSGFIPPVFCPQCTADDIEVYLGSSA